jgi:hypothetical protein
MIQRSGGRQFESLEEITLHIIGIAKLLPCEGRMKLSLLPMLKYGVVDGSFYKSLKHQKRY